jgi:hypothetical protein
MQGHPTESGSPKCAQCGLVNFAAAEECKRCGAALERPREEAADAREPEEGSAQERARRGFLKRGAWVLCMTGMLLLICHVSLLETSQSANYDQRQLVRRAVDLIEQRGFTRDAFVLRRLANYRTTDNWWNNWLGHGDAYAATNFPFEVLTLYPEFFNYPADDVERAVILLHEARHLSGSGEEEAFASVWRDKEKLGWTKDKYEQTRVWKNVGEFTRRYAPKLFRCGEDGRQDCTEYK